MKIDSHGTIFKKKFHIDYVNLIEYKWLDSRIDNQTQGISIPTKRAEKAPFKHFLQPDV